VVVLEFEHFVHLDTLVEIVKDLHCQISKKKKKKKRGNSSNLGKVAFHEITVGNDDVKVAKLSLVETETLDNTKGE